MTAFATGMQAVANDCNAQRPTAGKRVKGLIGIVTWHGVDKYNKDAWRYCSNAQTMLREVMGRYGYTDVEVCCCDGPFEDSSCEDPICVTCHKHTH